MKQTTQPTTRIREIRKARGFTLKELADKAKTTPQTIQRLETANMTVSMAWLEKIGRALDVPPYDLVPRPSTGATPERDFVDALGHALIRNRRMVPALEDVPLALMESVGSLSGLSLESRKGLRPWSDVLDAALAVAAAAMRIGVDGKTVRKVKLGEAA